MEIATEENFIMPTVYQGHYNVFCREYEDELFPVLKEFGIDFEAASPLAGGFLTGKLSYSPSPEVLMGSRFEVGNTIGAIYRMWYDQPVYHEAMRALDRIGSELKTTGAQCALRWLLFHSSLKDPDRIVIGPTSLEQLQRYLEARKAGPLTGDAAERISALWPKLKDESATIVKTGWWSL
jgi:aflatoxin B1 aldehyde reductase